MEQFEVRYLPSAEQDLDDITEYLMSKSITAAAHFLDDLDKAAGQISGFPLSGFILNDTRLQALAYRVVVIGNYLLFYVVKETYIEVRRIIHGSRNYEFLL